MKPAFLSMAIFVCGVPMAQSTWVVDGLSRPGTQFTDIQSALQAAAPGDLVLVRAGANYAGFTLNQPLRIIGQASANGDPPLIGGVVTVSGLPAGSQCMLSELFIASFTLFPVPLGFIVQNIGGTLHLSGVRVMSSNPGDIRFTDCADVRTHDCQFSCMGQPTVVRRSFVRASYSTFNNSLPGTLFGLAFIPSNALFVDNSTMLLQNCQIFGADESANGSQPSWFARNAFSGQNSMMVFGPGCIVRGGGSLFGTSWVYTTNAVQSWSGTLVRDPAVNILAPLALPISVQPITGTFITRVDQGQQFRIDVKGSPNGLAIVLASFAPPGSVGTPLGPLWLDLTSSIAVTGLTLDNQGFGFAVRTASPLAPTDVPYVVQAGLLDAAGTASLAEPMFFGVNLPRLP